MTPEQTAGRTRDRVGMPREIADGVFWLGDCNPSNAGDRVLHSYHSVFVVCGDDASLFVEAGHPQTSETLEPHIETLIEWGIPEPRYLFITHTELPHSGGIGRLMSRFPDAIACGDVTDLHLAFPQYADRLSPLNPGDRLDLGDTEFVVVEAVFRDYVTTRWGFDTKRRVLFTGDGFAYSHYHESGHCGKVAEEVPELEVPEMTAVFAERAFQWTTFSDPEPFIERLNELVFTEFQPRLIAPTHGLPIGDPAATMPSIIKGLRLGAHR